MCSSFQSCGLVALTLESVGSVCFMNDQCLGKTGERQKKTPNKHKKELFSQQLRKMLSVSHPA